MNKQNFTNLLHVWLLRSVICYVIILVVYAHDVIPAKEKVTSNAQCLENFRM